MSPATTMANDGFEAYFAEKLWEMIPSIYRHEDGLAENPGVLRSLVEVLAKQAAILRRSNDRLWEDQFIELCNEWAVPYIADLVATRILPEDNKRGRRVDVAKTIYYRRRKGTLRVLEELISDIAGWDGKVVENFRRLVRARHGLDPHPLPLAGRFSGSQPGGKADLRSAVASQFAGGPFDEYHHTPDFRCHSGVEGRYNITKLAFHLYRLKAYGVEGVTPFSHVVGPQTRWTFDPSGRSIPLFIRRNRPELNWDEWHTAMEWELPAPMRCRLLGNAVFFLTESIIHGMETDPGIGVLPAETALLRQYRGWRFNSEAELRAVFGGALAPLVYVALLSRALVSDCGKSAILEGGSLKINDSGTELPTERIQAGNLETWVLPSLSPEILLVVHPETGRFAFVSAPAGSVKVSYHYGFSGPIGAGTFPRPAVEDCDPTNPPPDWVGGGAKTAPDLATSTGVTQINDSKTYDVSITKNTVHDITFQAANGQRPYLRLGADLVFNTGPNLNSKLALDGLWLGCDGTQRSVVLSGDYECVVIRHCTFDPGGDTDIAGNTISPVRLVIRGAVEKLMIESSILGPIMTENAGIVTELFVSDSILQSVDNSVAVLNLSSGTTELDRVTLFGNANLHRLYASEMLASGIMTVQDTQNGCFRFSAAVEGSRLPRPYESFLFPNDTPHWFTSRKFGQPGYGQLSEAAPIAVQRGAENRSEIGAFSTLINPIKHDSLRVKVEEYMPFGLIPIFINET